MKKTWVKRENIYYRPFYKQKYKILLLTVFLLGIAFFIYQAMSISQLPNASTQLNMVGITSVQKSRQRLNLFPVIMAKDKGGGGLGTTPHVLDIRGIRAVDKNAYKPNGHGIFRCLDGSLNIPFEYVNDDYCDCIGDGSDEPSTNACPNGVFHCQPKKSPYSDRHGTPTSVPSSRINDGICDCCDGSDEWKTAAKCKNTCI